MESSAILRSRNIHVRCAGEHPLIFERPAMQGPAARRAMFLFTGIGWTVWAYLWRPLLTLLVWGFGVEVAGHQWIELDGLAGLHDFTFHVMPYGWVLCAALLAWASANYWRFHGSERRKMRPLSSLEADSEWARVPLDALAEARLRRNLVCYHDEEGHLTGVVPAIGEDFIAAFAIESRERTQERQAPLTRAES